MSRSLRKFINKEFKKKYKRLKLKFHAFNKKYIKFIKKNQHVDSNFVKQFFFNNDKFYTDTISHYDNPSMHMTYGCSRIL